VRAYTQTTGVWVRGILAEDYGVDLGSLKWVTFEEGHVAEYADPPNVRRAPEGKQLVQMLLDGELDAAVVGDKFPDPRLAPLIPDAEAANHKWSQSHGGVPINHMLVIREELARTRPDVVREVYRLFLAAKQAAFAQTGAPALDPWRFGIEANRRSLEIVIDFAVEQGLIPRRIPVDELFGETMRALGRAQRSPIAAPRRIASSSRSKTFRVRGGPGGKEAVLAVLRHVSFAVGENEALVTQNCVACHAGYRLH